MSRVQVLVFFNRHSTTMNLMEEKQRGPIPTYLKRWHVADITCFSSSPAGPKGYLPLNFINLINLCCILQLRPNQSFVCNFLSTLSQVPAKETKCLSYFGRDFRDVLMLVHAISDGYTKVYCILLNSSGTHSVTQHSSMMNAV